MTVPENISDLVDFSQIDALLEVAGRDGVTDIMDAFWRSTDALTRQLRALLNERNYAEAAKAAHALKGSAANVGAQLLAVAARGIELGCKGSDAEAAGSALQSLQDACERTRNAMAERIGQAA